jgi:hypothetical protein
VRRPLALAALALLAACPPKRVERPGPPPTAAQLVQHLRERVAKIARLRTEAKVDYLEQNGQRVKLTMTFLTERTAAGGKLRIDAENPLGGALAALACDGARFELLDARENRFLAGEASACNLGRLLRIQLAPGELIDAVDGGAPILGDPVSVGWDDRDGGSEVLTLARGDLRETIKLSPKEWDVRWAEVRQGAAVLYTLEHGEFEAQGAVRFPGRTVIADPRHKADARIRYRSREIDPAAPAGAFELAAPAGMAVETVRCE